MNSRSLLGCWAVTLAVLVLLAPAARAGSLLVVNMTADPSQGDILQYDLATGAPLGSGPLVAAGTGGLNAPAGLALGPDGNLYVANGFDSSVLEFDAQGNPLGAFVPSGAGGLQGPASLVFGPDGNLYVASLSTSSVLEYNGMTGSFIQALVPGGAGGLVDPGGVVFHDGDLYIASRGTGEILRYDASTGQFLGSFVSAGAGGVSQPSGLAFGPDGNLYVASQGSDSILSFDGHTGAFLGTFVAGGTGGLSSPADLLFEPNGDLLVASGSGEVLSYGSDGGFLGTLVPAGSGGLNLPISLLASVPEPGSLTLSLIGLAGTIVARLRRSQVRADAVRERRRPRDAFPTAARAKGDIEDRRGDRPRRDRPRRTCRRLLILHGKAAAHPVAARVDAEPPLGICADGDDPDRPRKKMLIGFRTLRRIDSAERPWVGPASARSAPPGP